MQAQETKHNGPFRRGREISFLILALALIAILATFRGEPSGVATISGLSLEESRASVESKLGTPNFNSTVAQGPVTVEYWSNSDRPQINVSYDANNKVRKLERGTPEVNGIPVPEADIATLKGLLGHEDHEGRGRARAGANASGEGSRIFLAYPNHNLLVYREQEKNSFILFRSNRK